MDRTTNVRNMSVIAHGELLGLELRAWRYFWSNVPAS